MTPNCLPRTLIFIDANVDQIGQLVAGVQASSDVHLLSAHLDGIQQITDILADYAAAGIRDRAIHIVAHGAPGALYLGNTELSLSTLAKYAPQLRTWFSAGTGELLLYGCNVAAGDAGAEFLAKLHAFTQVGIAASTQTIGQGHWHLDANPHQLTTTAPFTDAVLTAWSGQLSHFRGGQITWTPEDFDGDGIDDDAFINVVTAWGSFTSPPSSLSGLSAVQTVESQSNITVNTTNAGNYTLTTTVIRADNFANINTAETGFYTSGDRISNLQNNADGSWNIQTTVFLANGNEAPQIDFPIIVDVPTLDANGNALPDWTYLLQVVDPDGDNIRYRLASTVELGNGVQPTGFSIDSSTGLITWNGSGGLTNGLYSAGLVVEDLDSNGNVISKSHVDFILNLVDLQATPISVSGDINATQTTVNLAATETVSYTFDGSVTVQSLSGAGGALSGSSPSFTFDASQVGPGVYPVTFLVSQSGRADSYKTYNFVVADANAPEIANLGGDTAVWNGNDAVLDVGSDSLVTYGGGSDLNGGFLRFNPAFVDAGESLQVVPTGDITVSGSTISYQGQAIGTISGTDNGVGTALRIDFTSAAATPMAIAALLKSITYDTSAGSPTLGNRSASVVISDGTLSNNYTVNINVQQPVSNSNPTVSAPISRTYDEDDGSVTVTVADLLTGASDPNGDTLSIQNLTFNPASITTNVSDTTAIAALLQSAVVASDANGITVNTAVFAGLDEGVSISGTFTYNIIDGNGGSVAQTATVTIEGRPDLYWHRGSQYSDWFNGFNDASANGLNATWQVGIPLAGANTSIALTGGAYLFAQNVSSPPPTNPTGNIAEPDLNWYIAGAGDFNNDGFSDIVWRHEGVISDGTPGAVAVWYMRNGERVGGAFLQNEPDAAWELQAVADIDNDGDADLFWRNNGSTNAAQAGLNAVWVMENGQRADGYFIDSETNINPQNGELEWRIGGVGDFDGDGLENDILWRSYVSGTNAVWFLDSTGRVREGGDFLRQADGITLLNEPDTNWAVGGVADFNGDGSSDILFRHMGTIADGTPGAMAVWFMDGTTRTDGAFIANQADTLWDVAV